MESEGSITVRRPRGWWLFPRFEERLSVEFYRFTGKLRVVIAGSLTITNLLAHFFFVDDLGLDKAAYTKLFMFHLPTHLVDVLLGLWVWKGRLSQVGMRRASYACMFLETITILVLMWGYGSVNSHMIAFAVVMLLTYRLAFDFRLGITALGLMVLGHWAIVIAEIRGWIPPQPLTTGKLDTVYLRADTEVGAAVFITILCVLTFAIANWAVARMRFKDVTIRMLRESLYASAGRVGRHTGRTLCNTYVVGALIGSGGMGEVYRGEHRRTRRQLALKLLHPHLVEDPQVLKRFQREAEVTGQLGSENIVEIIDVDDDDGQPFLALEYLEGESLGARIVREGQLDLKTVVEIAHQLGGALETAHAAGVVHRDLKPENVFLCKRVNGSLLVKVLDFGVSKIGGNATALTQEVAILGTPDFMSPEQAVGLREEIGVATDIFAFGGLIYATITGRHPFTASSIPALLRRVCEEQPRSMRELRSDLPEAVEDVVAIAMAKRPDERYESPSELARDLAAAIKGTLDPAVRARAQTVTRGRPMAQSSVQHPAGVADTLPASSPSEIEDTVMVANTEGS